MATKTASDSETPVAGKRKPAPAASVSRVWTNERSELLETYAPECLGEDSEYTAYWGDAAEPPARRKRMGYEPVPDPETNEQVTHNGDPLWKTLRENSEARIARPAMQSREMLQSRWTAEDADSKAIHATVDA